MKNEKYNWDLESLLGNKPLEHLYQEWFSICQKQCKLVKDFYKSKEQFAQWLALDLESDKISNRLIAYISNHNNEDLSDQKWVGWLQKLSHDATVFGQQLYMYSNLVIKNEKKIRTYLADPKLAKWKRAFELMFRSKGHYLDTACEKLMSKLSVDGYSNTDIFTTITESDMKYEDALDKNGKKHQIKTHADYWVLLKNKDRVLRKNVWINFNKQFDTFKNTLTKTLYYNYLRANAWAKARNYKGFIDATLFNDEVNEKLLFKIYDNVEKFKKLYFDFRTIRSKNIKKLYKLNKLEPWDLGLDLYKKNNKVTIEQAKQEAINALSPFGEEYVSYVKQAFNDNWISWLSKANKMQGAYSIGETYGLDKYYILMNFDYTQDSVSALVHELGHSINSLYTNKHQDVYASADMFLVEVASVVNETMLSLYWMKKYANNKEMLLQIYDNLLYTFFTTTSVQVVFSKFEYLANEIISSGKPFTTDVVKDLYLSVRKQYEGFTKKGLKNINKYPYCLTNTAILRISTFYSNSFYVYKYALGQMIALLIAYSIFNGDEKVRKNYIEFLSAGCSKPPLELLKILGFDLNNDDFYNKVINIIKKMLKTFKKISRK